MTGAPRSFHTAIAAAKARMQAEWEKAHLADRDDDEGDELEPEPDDAA